MVPFDRTLAIFISLPLQLFLYFVPFPRYYHLFPKIQRGHVTLNASLSDVIYIIIHALVVFCIKQQTKFAVHSITNKNMIGDKIFKRSRNPDHAY